MNPNQDLVDLINLNSLEDANSESSLLDAEKEDNQKAINFKRSRLMKKAALSFSPEQVEQAEKNKRDWDKYVEENEEEEE